MLFGECVLFCVNVCVRKVSEELLAAEKKVLSRRDLAFFASFNCKKKYYRQIKTNAGSNQMLAF